MTELLFYHLHRQPIERVLPTLLEQSLERGWRVVVQASSEERVEALDAHLWTYSDDSFLPHGTWREQEAAAQPILLTVNDTIRTERRCASSIDGAPVPQDAASYARIVLLFDGEDDEAVGGARASAGAKPSAAASTSPIGSPTSAAAGSARRERRALCARYPGAPSCPNSRV